MPSTLKYGITYPAGNVAPNVPLAMQSTAESTEAAIDVAADKTSAGMKTFTRISAATGAIGGTKQVVFNFPTFSFKAGRVYRIRWNYNYTPSNAGSYGSYEICSSAVSDGAGVTTGLTPLETSTSVGQNGGFGQTGFVEAMYKPGSDVTQQIKFTCQVVVGSGTHTLPTALYYIEDLGKQL